MAYIYDLVDTWNNAATVFTAIKMNVTDTASNASSLLMDLQVGGASKVNATKGGKIWASGGLTVSGAADDATLSNGSGWTSLKNLNGGAGISFAPYGGNQTTAYLNLTGTSINVPSGAVFGWSSTTDPTATRDTFLTRRAAANLRLGAADAAAPVAQTLSVQSVVAGTLNTAGANWTFTGSQGTGTGAGGSIIFQVAPAGSSGTAQNALATALTIGSNKNATFEGFVTGDNGGFLSSWGSDGGAGLIYLGIRLGGNSFVGWAPVAPSSGTYDTRLYRDAANALALRNGTNAQTFNVYGTYTDASNYERLTFIWSSNRAIITTATAGTGTIRDLYLQNDQANQNIICASTVKFSIDNTYDIGAFGANRPRNLYLGSSILLPASGVITYDGRAEIRSYANGNLTFWNSAGTDFGRLQFGGTTSAFPALKRSGATLQARLADDSNFADFSVKSLTVTSGSLTGASAPAVDATQTWNDAAVTFTGYKFNVTDTASNASSLLMDLQVGGSSKFSVRKDGYLVAGFAAFNFANRLVFGHAAGTGGWLQASTDQGYSWMSTTSPGSADLFLSRRAAANLRLGAADAAAAVAQTLSVQSVVAGTLNTAGANWTFTGSQGTGTGAGGSIIFQVAPAGSSGTAQNALATALTIDSARITYITASNGYETRFNTNGIDLYFLNSRIGSINHSSVSGQNWLTLYGQNGVSVYGALSIGNGNAFLNAEAANTLALRNGANAQSFLLYNTYTDASNYEVGGLSWSSNALNIFTDKAGSGSYRNLNFYIAGATRWFFNTSGNFLAQADNTYDIGASGANRPRNLFVAGIGTFGLVEAPTYYANAGTRMRLGETNGNVRFHNAVDNNFGLMIFGIATSSFPALKRSSTTLQVRLADDSNFTDISLRSVVANGVTFANLPATPTAGAIAYVTDASNAGAAWGDAVTAGGSTNKYLVWYNGTNWTVLGK